MNLVYQASLPCLVLGPYLGREDVVSSTSADRTPQ